MACLCLRGLQHTIVGPTRNSNPAALAIPPVASTLLPGPPPTLEEGNISIFARNETGYCHSLARSELEKTRLGPPCATTLLA
jgi:hypothetical protein